MGPYINNLRANGTVTNLTLQQMFETVQSNATVEYIINLFEDSTLLYNKIRNNLTEESQNLFETHILLQHSIHYYSNLIINDIYNSALNYYYLNYQTSFNIIVDSMNKFQDLFGYFRNAEKNIFRGFYQASAISDFQAVRFNLRRLYILVNNSKHCTLPTRPYTYYAFTWYQLPYHDNYPMIYFNKSSHLSSYVRIACINTGSEINNNNSSNQCCINNYKGGIFHVNTNNNNNNINCLNGAMVKFNVTDWTLCPYIRYTKDGSIPNQNSILITNITNILNITQNTTLNARCQYLNKSLDTQITQTFYQRI